MFKRFLCLFVLIAIAVISIGCTPNKPTKKEYIGESISYVSLGDSIPEGYGLSNYANKSDDGFVSDSYTDSLKIFFKDKYKNVTAHNYAQTGLTSTQLKDQLLALDGDSLSQTQEEMKSNIESADVITVCIGANDILGPAQNNFINILLEEDISPYLSQFDNGIAIFNTNFPIIVNTLRELNPTAKLIFSNIYNPYAALSISSSNIEIYYSMFKIYDIPSDRVNLIGQIAEAYIDADIVYNSNKEPIKTVETGLNQIIQNSIIGVENCHVLDVKSCFDTYLAENNSYDIVNSTVLNQNQIYFELSNPLNMEQNLIEIQEQIVPYIDPHPSIVGHGEIKTIIIEKVSNILNLE